MSKKTTKTSRKADVRIPFPNMLAGFLVCAAVVGLSYVWVCARCDTLGSEIKQLESELRTARQRAITEQDRWSNMLAPANVERALDYHELAMSLPDERQIVRVRRGTIESVLTLAYNNP
jgi:hypothetical protein